MGWLAFLGNLPSAFWTSLMAFAKTIRDGAVGAAFAKLWDMLQQSKRLNEQFADILRVEQENADRPVSGAAERLRNSSRNRDRGLT